MAVIAGCGVAPGDDPSGTSAGAGPESEEQAVALPDGGATELACTGKGHCPGGMYCATGRSGQCPSARSPGVCATRPRVCTLIHDPVMACDGRRHPSPCAAAAAGVAVPGKPLGPGPIPTPIPLQGPSPSPPGGESCGNVTCAVGLVCCDPLCGTCTRPDGICTKGCALR